MDASYRREPSHLSPFFTPNFDLHLKVGGFDEPVVLRIPRAIGMYKFKVKHPHDLRYQLRHFQEGNVATYTRS